jgi:hypothetical protein
MATTIKSKRKKPTHDRKRAMLVNELATKYKVTTEFVRLAIKKERQTELAEKILKDYNIKYNELSKIFSR